MAKGRNTRAYHKRCWDVECGHFEVVNRQIAVHLAGSDAASWTLGGDGAAGLLKLALELVKLCVVQDWLAGRVGKRGLQEALLVRAG